MTEVHHNMESYEEVNLGELLRQLYRRKWHILGTTLAVGLMAAGIMLQKSNVYESTAALIVREPELPITGGALILSIETLQTLAVSNEITWTLFERLWEEQALEIWKGKSSDKMGGFRGFLGSLSSELKEQRDHSLGTDSFQPILVLQVRAGSPSEAETVANAWANIVVSRSQSIYTQGLQELDAIISDLYTRADRNLVVQENLLSSQTVEADLDLKKARFQEYRQKVISLEHDLFVLEIDIYTAEVLMEEIASRLAVQEYEGNWLGDAAEDFYVGGTVERLEEEMTSPAARKILKYVRTVVDQEQALVRFVSAFELESKKGEERAMRAGLDSSNGRLFSSRLELSHMLREQENVQKLLAEQEVEGVWIGELLNKYHRRELNRTGESVAEDALMDKPTIDPQTKRVDETTRDIVEREFSLLKYEEESAIEFMKTQFSLFESDLRVVLAGRDRAQKSLVLGDRRLAFLIPELSTLPEKLSLDKAITDDVLWQNHLQGRRGNSILTPLKTEVLNPIHQRVWEQVLDLTAETEVLREEISFLAERERELRGRIDTLRKEIMLTEMEIQNRKSGIDVQKSVMGLMAASYKSNKTNLETLVVDNQLLGVVLLGLEASQDDGYRALAKIEEDILWAELQVSAKKRVISISRNTLGILAQDYQRERTQVESLALEQIRKRAEKALKEKLLKSSTLESEELQEEIAQLERDVNLVQREVDKIKDIRMLLATRAEEAALLKISAESASLTGTAILYNAQANPIKVAPTRSRAVLTSMLAAFSLCCFLVFLSKIVTTKN